MDRKQKGIIKFYEYQVGNNCLVGNEEKAKYDDTEVPKWYRVQAEIYQDTRQLADLENSDSEEADADNSETENSDLY
ncbi:MAG: hypothetical protein PHP50_04960 [Lachnospiraceae bacterium]|nr:hypothetical protein [Lachnospiraceae bacterium]